MLVGFPFGLVTMLFGGKIIELIYGDEFRSAGATVIVLATLLFTIMGYSNGPLLNAVGRQYFFAWTQGLLVLANTIFCLLFIPRWGPVGAALATSLSFLGGLLVHTIACHRQLGLSLPWMTTVKTIFSTLATGIVILAANRVGITWWVVALIVAPLTFMLQVLLLKLINLDELRFLASGVPR
jgi:O-antigen/teichoic acid export membrane protein